jgi:transposase-like protein
MWTPDAKARIIEESFVAGANIAAIGLKAMMIPGLEREAWMKRLLGQLKRATFGRRSEKLSADQRALAFEDIEVAQAELLALTEQSASGRRPRRNARKSPNVPRCQRICRESAK